MFFILLFFFVNHIVTKTNKNITDVLCTPSASKKIIHPFTDFKSSLKNKYALRQRPSATNCLVPFILSKYRVRKKYKAVALPTYLVDL